MRRPGLLIAGVMLATGASLALAAPASAAGTHDGDHKRHSHCDNHGHHHHWYGGYDDYYWHHRHYGGLNIGINIGVGIGLGL